VILALFFASHRCSLPSGGTGVQWPGALQQRPAAPEVASCLPADNLARIWLPNLLSFSMPPCPLPQAALDYAALDLQPFYAGALVRFDGDFHRVADPLRWGLRMVWTTTVVGHLGRQSERKHAAFGW